MDGALFPIFSHLPAKSIFRFSAVSNECNELLTGEFFRKTQSKNFETKDQLAFFLHLKNHYPTDSSLQINYLSNLHESTSGIPNNSLISLRNIGYVIASSGGLLCCRNMHDNKYPLLLCNPATSEWLPISAPVDDFKPETRLMTFLFECGAFISDDDHVLMVMFPDTSDWNSQKYIFKLYSKSRSTWEDRDSIQVGPRNMSSHTPTYLKKDGGDVYMLSNFGACNPFYWPYIVSYSIKNSSSVLLQIPKGARKGIKHVDSTCELAIHRFKDPQTEFESICFVKYIKGVFSVWVLMSKIDGNKWKRIMKTSTKGMRLKGVKPEIFGFTIMNGNLLLIATKDEIYRYDLSFQQRRSCIKAEKIGDHECGERQLNFHSYASTLRSCGPAAMPLPAGYCDILRSCDQDVATPLPKGCAAFEELEETFINLQN